MASVFGIPISVETLRATGEYEEPITQKDVADYTMQMINAGEKDTHAQNFVDNLKGSYGNGTSTKCLIYNATGTTLNFVTSNDWHGHIYDPSYPPVIQNGQWGAYLHVHSALAPAGSAAAVVYRSNIPSSSSSCDWMFSWRIPFIGDNRVYTEIREEGHFPPHWDYIYHMRLEKSGRSSTDKGYGYVSNTDIGEGTTVNARAIFSMEPIEMTINRSPVELDSSFGSEAPRRAAPHRGAAPHRARPAHAPAAPRSTAPAAPKGA